LFHPESPVKVDKLLELIRAGKSRYRLSPDGRLSFSPRSQEWAELIDEVTELLRAVADRQAAREVALPDVSAPA
jgi:hypothetical protein